MAATRARDDSVRSPSTRSYLPEVNFLRREESLFSAAFAVFAPLGGGTCLRPFVVLVEDTIIVSFLVLYLLQLFLIESVLSFVGFINSRCGAVISENWGFKRLPVTAIDADCRVRCGKTVCTKVKITWHSQYVKLHRQP